jgi:hypothetical protein
MKEKCCRNCFYFEEEIDWYSDGRTKIKYHCQLHDGEVSEPDYQRCGSGWLSVKIKKRIDNLDKLVI